MRATIQLFFLRTHLVVFLIDGLGPGKYLLYRLKIVGYYTTTVTSLTCGTSKHLMLYFLFLGEFKLKIQMRKNEGLRGVE